jgi:hypothetical protein
MFKHIILSSILIAFVKAEGYYCPYESLGFDGRNDLLYDYYDGKGDYWVRMGRTGWETRESYCRAKGNPSLHSDAGEAKCQDSQGTCMWSGSSCDINPSKQPDCYELCKAVKDGNGLQCLGNCPGGNSDRSQLYSICNLQNTNTNSTTTNTNTQIRTRPRPRPRPKVSDNQNIQIKMEKTSKKLTCVCREEL